MWIDIIFNLPEIRRAIKRFAERSKTVKERPMYQNDLWLRFIRTLILFFVQFHIFDIVSCNFNINILNNKTVSDLWAFSLPIRYNTHAIFESNL